MSLSKIVLIGMMTLLGFSKNTRAAAVLNPIQANSLDAHCPLNCNLNGKSFYVLQPQFSNFMIQSRSAGFACSANGKLISCKQAATGRPLSRPEITVVEGILRQNSGVTKPAAH